MAPSEPHAPVGSPEESGMPVGFFVGAIVIAFVLIGLVVAHNLL